MKKKVVCCLLAGVGRRDGGISIKVVVVLGGAVKAVGVKKWED